jgi:outer membrane lipoprotein-sorting protein
MSALALPIAHTSLIQAADAKAADTRAPAAKDASKAAPTADEILKKAGDALFPEQFTAQIEMTQYKPGTPDNVSRMMLYKRGANLVRSDYIYPPLQAGQRMLRKEGQIWMYMSDIKRPIKMSPKQSLGGSDFNNGDIMRLNLVEDYTPTIEKEDATSWVLNLKAKDRSVAYDMIKYTVEKKDFKSVRQEFYTLSGKQIKTLEFQEYRDYNGLKRPSVFVMKSSLAQGVYTTMKYTQFEPGKTLPEAQFKPDALAKQ